MATLKLSIPEIICKLLRFELGTSCDLDIPNNIDWRRLIKVASKQCVKGLVLDGLYKACQMPEGKHLLESMKQQNIDPKYEWIGFNLKLDNLRKTHERHILELVRIFDEAGFRSCVLKGQGLALLYPNPTLRTPGDIDLLVEGGREKIVGFVKSKWNTGKITNHHVQTKIFKDTDVEVHYVPAWLYNPINDRKLQAFFTKELSAQFSNRNEIGFCHPTIRFNLIFCAIHVYKHMYEKSITMKQIVDYFYILKHSTNEEREFARDFLCSLGLKCYVENLMYGLQKRLAIPEEYMLCQPRKHSARPVSEFICLYPWKVCHYVWRKYKRYI